MSLRAKLLALVLPLVILPALAGTIQRLTVGAKREKLPALN